MFPRLWFVPMPALFLTVLVLAWGPSPNTVALAAARANPATAMTPLAVASPWLLTQGPCPYGCTCCAIAGTKIHGADPDLTVKAGTSVSLDLMFSCLIGGPVTTYQWQKDGQNIPSATGATYTISSVRHCDQGVYRCRFSIQCSPTFFFYSLPADLEISSHGPPSTPPAAVGESGIAAAHMSTEQILPHSGEMVVTAVDLRIPGRGIDFVWARTYRSRTGPKDASSGIGYGWDHAYNLRVKREEPTNPSNHDLVLFDGATRQDRLVYNGSTYTAAELFVEGVESPANVITLTFPNKSEWKFFSLMDAQIGRRGKIQTITDRNGNQLVFDYDTLGRLSVIHDTLDTAAHQRDIHINYVGSNIQSVVDFAGRAITYQYSLGSDLIAVNSPAVINDPPNNNDFPTGKRTAYTYSVGFTDIRLNHNLLTITDGRNQTYLANVYATTANLADINFDRVLEQRLGNANDKIAFYYTCTPQSGDSLLAVTNDRVGNVTWDFFGDRNRLVQTRRYTGRPVPGVQSTETSNLPGGKLRTTDPDYFTTVFEYNSDSLPTRITKLSSSQPTNGSEIQYTYQMSPVRARGNTLSIRRTPGALGGTQSQLVESFAYDPDFNLVTSATDARGSVTSYTRDSWGNVVLVAHSISSIVEDFEYNPSIHGQLIAHTSPSNGSGQRRREEYNYFGPADGARNGYLRASLIAGAGSSGLDLVTQYERDLVGNVNSITDPVGNRTTIAVNSLNQVWLVTSPEVLPGTGIHYKQGYKYDGNDNVLQVNASNQDENGLFYPNDTLTTQVLYEVLNHPSAIAREVDSGHDIVEVYEYDGNRNLIRVRSGEATNGHQPGNTVRTYYDERDLPYRIVRAESDASNHSTTQYDYDINGNLVHVAAGLESNPHDTFTEFDGFGRQVSTVDAMGNITNRTFDPNGNLLYELVRGQLNDVPGGSGNVRLREISYTYDAMNRLSDIDERHFDRTTHASIDGGHRRVHTDFTDNSQPRHTVVSSSRRASHAWVEYDRANHVLQERDDRGNRVEYSYDANERPAKVTRTDVSDVTGARQTTTILRYDPLGRLAEMRDNLNIRTKFKYDSRGNRVLVVEGVDSPPPFPRTTRSEFDGLGRLRATCRDLDGNGRFDDHDICSYQTLDDNSRLVSQTDAGGNTTTYAYDNLDRLGSVILADSATVSEIFGYDVHDNVVLRSDANGTQTSSGYDSLNRLARRTVSVFGPGVSPTTTFESYHYDGLSQLVAALDDDSAVLREHDSLGNMTSETLLTTWDPVGRTVRSAYDSLGARVSLSYPGGRQLQYVPNGLNLPTEVVDRASGWLARIKYFGPARVERRDFRNSTHSSTEFDAVQRIASTTFTHDSLGIFGQRSYSYDQAYNKTGIVQSSPTNDTWSFVHDRADRMVRSTYTPQGSSPFTTDYGFDPVGNRLSVRTNGAQGSHTSFGSETEYRKDPALPVPGDRQMNQYTTGAGRRFTYDNNGNVLTVEENGPTSTTGSPTLLQTLTYDYRNELVRHVKVSSPPEVSTYYYDALGRRIAKTVGSVSTRFYYDGDRVVEERDGVAAIIATYAYGAGTTDVLSMQRDVDPALPGPEDYYFHTDDLGNVIALTGPGGAVKERYTYDDYGKPTITTYGPTISGLLNPYLFRSARYDNETSFVELDKRPYNPTLGQSISRASPTAVGENVSPGTNGSRQEGIGNNPYSRERLTFLQKLADSIRDARPYYGSNDGPRLPTDLESARSMYLLDHNVNLSRTEEDLLRDLLLSKFSAQMAIRDMESRLQVVGLLAGALVPPIGIAQAVADIAENGPQWRHLVFAVPLIRGVRGVRGFAGELRSVAAEESAISRAAGSRTAATGAVQTFRESELLFSQSSARGIEEIAAGMRARGWVGAPVDVVAIEGRLITIDNTRVAAAYLSGTPVQAIVRRAGDALPTSMAGRFVSASGVEAGTWGEAVLTRIGNQSAGYRNLYPLGSRFIGLSR